jgi:hypothetical protein
MAANPHRWSLARVPKPTCHAAFAFLILLVANCVFAQSVVSPAPSPSLQQPATAGQPAPDKEATPAPAGKVAVAAKPRKVITNDDLERGSGRSSRKVPDGESGSLLTCEAACEQAAREEVGYDADREAEWQMQVVSARRELIEDTEWRQLLLQAIRESNTYCRFLAQQSQKVSPSGNSYNARVQRAKANQYFENMDHVLRQNLDSVTNRMTARTNEVGALSPVRAAMMYVQGNRILQRECEGPGTR